MIDYVSVGKVSVGKNVAIALLCILKELYLRPASAIASCCQSLSLAGHAQVRNLKKKLQQIEGLRGRPLTGLDPQQRNKLSQEASLQAALDALETGASLSQVPCSCPVPQEVMGSETCCLCSAVVLPLNLQIHEFCQPMCLSITIRRSHWATGQMAFQAMHGHHPSSGTGL